MIRLWLAIAGLGGVASVVAGALAAHLADDTKSAELLHTGALYGMVHAGALVAVVALGARRQAVRVAGWSFAAGIVLFTFSLFALAAGAPRWVGWVTPVGGVALIVGWAALASIAVARRRQQ
jgi:uncharacterized membrane protein YgdD (TMEM256/DUF423 family)